MCDESVKFDLCLKFRIRMLVGAHWSKAEVSNSVSVRQNLDLTHLPGSFSEPEYLDLLVQVSN